MWQDPGKLEEIPVPESGQIGRFFAPRPDLFDREIRTSGQKKYASAGAGVRTGVGELAGGRTRIQTYFGFPTAKKIQVPYSLVESLLHFSQVQTFFELFSVELRRSHQTRHAAEGVRTCEAAGTNGPSESIRCNLIREMNVLLRQDQKRTPGTGQDCKLRWETPAQGKTGSAPGHLQPVPVPTRNSANAATVAVLRVRKVPFWPHCAPRTHRANEHPGIWLSTKTVQGGVMSSS